MPPTFDSSTGAVTNQSRMESAATAANMLLQEGVKISTLGSQGCTALHYAAVVGDEDVVQVLLQLAQHWQDLPEALKAMSESGFTPLELAAVNNDAAATQRLLTAGSAHGSALVHAAAEGAEAAVNVLLCAGASISTKAAGHTALLAAVRHNQAAVLQQLLTVAASQDPATRTAVLCACDSQGLPALQLAALLGQDEHVELLLQAGVDPAHALFFAARSAAETTMQGTSQAHNSNGKASSSSGGHARSRDMAAITDPDGLLGLYAGPHVCNPSAAALQLLFNAIGSVNKLGAQGCTALHLAAQHANPAVLRLLLDLDIPAEVKSVQGLTPLQLAIRTACKPTLVKAFLQAGVTPGMVLISTATAGNQAAVQTLVDAGADVSTFNCGATALLEALQRGYNLVVTQLLSAMRSVPDANNRNTVLTACRQRMLPALLEAFRRNKQPLPDFITIQQMLKAGVMPVNILPAVMEAGAPAHLLSQLTTAGACLTVTSGGKTPVVWALKGTDTQVMSWVLSAAADLDDLKQRKDALNVESHIDELSFEGANLLAVGMDAVATVR